MLDGARVSDVNVAAVTMTYNESDFLPIWARHYAAQVGSRNCYVVDHSSDDGSTQSLGDANVVWVPRSPYDPEKCTRFISDFCTSLLEWYDWVLYTDADEILVADPAHYESLTQYCTSCNYDVVTAIGFNLVHTRQDAPIDPARNILQQRRWMNLSAALSKPALTRKRIVWSAGFHWAFDVAAQFDHLYLFHLRFLDRDIGLRRLAKTRAQPWAYDGPEDPGWYARVPDKACLRMFRAYDKIRRNAHVEVHKDAPEVLHAISQIIGSSEASPDTYAINYQSNELWPIPARFRTVF
jgi:Glycosyl transferase family 2